MIQNTQAKLQQNSSKIRNGGLWEWQSQSLDLNLVEILWGAMHARKPSIMTAEAVL
jgi:hypothetical protein